MKVLDGPHNWSTSLGTFCGGLHPTLLKSTSEFLRIQFHSSKSSSHREGFHLQFMKYTPGIRICFSALTAMMMMVDVDDDGGGDDDHGD